MEKIQLKLKKRNPNIHSELHYIVDIARKQFHETAKRGKGSFGYYLGYFKRFNSQMLYQFLSDVKEADDPKRLFWWKIGKELKKECDCYQPCHLDTKQ